MYFTKAPGIGGRLRQRIEDFFVEEVPKEISGEGHTIFWMEKFNWDTNRALKAIAKSLHLSVTRLGVAGTKDRRSVSRQLISAWNVKKEDLEKVKISGIKLYDFKEGGRISLGDLKGNNFKAIIRDVGFKESEIMSRLESLFKELSMMPNFFGVQRFGEVRKLTHLVGKEIIKGNFEGSVKIYLAEIFEGEPEDSKKAREFLKNNWNKGGFLEALKIFPKDLMYERSMLDYLYKNPSDFVGAIRRLPIRLRKMFLNAYQSYLWNKAAEKMTKSERSLKIPMVGFDTKLSERSPLGKGILAMLKEDGISLEDFRIKSMPELSCYGTERELFVRPKNMKIVKISEDEYNPGKRAVEISFFLPSGSYATVLLKEIMKSG